VDRGREAGCGQPDATRSLRRFTEFWNLVLPQYDQRADLSGPPTTAEAIQRALLTERWCAEETGDRHRMGLERISFILSGKTNVFETDLLAPLSSSCTSTAPNRLS